MAPDRRVPPALRAATGLAGLEALALLAAAVVLVVKTVDGHPDDLGRALLAAALAVAGGLFLALAARSVAALRPAARTPIVVVQLLALPVAYSLWFQAGLVRYGAPLLLAALTMLFLLFTPASRAALNRTD